MVSAFAARPRFVLAQLELAQLEVDANPNKIVAMI
jgi:hypothetical protein